MARLPEGYEYLIIIVPKTLKKTYQKKCIDTGISMTKEILRHVQEYVGETV